MRDDDKFVDLVQRWEDLQKEGEPVSPETLCAREPELLAELEQAIHRLGAVGALVRKLAGPESGPADGGTATDAWPVVPGYEVLAELGRGAMGVVYRARHLRLDRAVALKMLRAGTPVAGEEFVRFRNEAEAVARLQHPNILQIHEIGEADGRPYLSLELVEGDTLARRLAGTPLPPREAARLVETLARAVHAAHQRDVVHRDLKPANVLLTADGTPKVADFGLAKRLDKPGSPTVTGAILGTPSYMAPEQAGGKNREIGPAADIYALGAIMYEALTGRPPFKAATPLETVLQVLSEEPVSPSRLQSQVPRDLETVVLKCLQKVPGRRYATADDLALDLQRYLSGMPIRARPVPAWERGWKWVKRRPAAAVLLAAALLAPVAAGAAGVWLHQVRASRAASLVDNLLAVDTARIPEVIDELKACPYSPEPRLRALYQGSPSHSPVKLRAALALLRFGGEGTDYLFERMLVEGPAEVKTIRDALKAQRSWVSLRLWKHVLDPEANLSVRVRAACALADLDASSDHWQNAGREVVAGLVREEPSLVSGWTDLLRPVRGCLMGPLQEVMQHGKGDDQARLAAAVLAEYLGTDVPALVRMVRDADPSHLVFPVAKLRLHPVEGEALLAEVVARPLSGETTQEEKNDWARHRANVAAALLTVAPTEDAWALFKHSPDPRLRTYLIHRLGPAGVAPEVISERLDQEPDASIRRALILSLGGYDPPRINPRERRALIEKLGNLYRHDPDPGVHSAAEWLLREWGAGDRLRVIESVVRRGEPLPGSRWYVTSEGHTMALVPKPDSFQMGSGDGEPGRGADETLRSFTPEPFAIGTKEVTVEQFRRFRRKPHPKETPRPEVDLPATWVSYLDAMCYCNWLSAREGLPPEEWCYLAPPGGPAEDVKPCPGYLRKRGYRLPTEEEWEYACRAGAKTSRFYGESEDMLPYYASCTLNSRNQSGPVGRFKPNDLGLFDALGNVMEWCSNSQGNAPDSFQVLRGASFKHSGSALRSAVRSCAAPESSYNHTGFRVARSLAP